MAKTITLYLENIPQLLISIDETISFRTTVTFIQAFNPIMTLSMLYMKLGGGIGKMTLIIYLSMINHDSGALLLLGLQSHMIFIFLIPYYVTMKVFDANFLLEKDVNPELFLNGLL